MRGAASILLALALVLAGCHPQSMPLRVALTPEGRLPGDPMCHLDERGQLTGLLPELAGLLAAELGRPLVLVEMPPDQLYTSLERGEADLVLHDGAPPAGLAPYLALSPAWGASAVGLVFPATMFKDLGVLEIRPGSTIHTTPTLFADENLRKALPQAQWKILPITGHALEEVPAAWHVQVLDQRTILDRAWQESGEPRFPLIFPPDLAGTATLWQLAYGPGVSAGERDALNQRLLGWRGDSTLKPLVERHLPREARLMQSPTVPNYVDGAWISGVETARSR